MKNGVWHSLVVRLVRDQEAAGSNPVTPTIKKKVHQGCSFFFMVGPIGKKTVETFSVSLAK